MGIAKTPPHPLVMELRRQMDRSRVNIDALIEKSGLGRGTVHGWFYLGTVPTLEAFSKAVRAAKAELVIRANHMDLSMALAEAVRDAEKRLDI